MKTLFLAPPTEEMMFPSLGIAYLTSVLNKNGHEAELRDGAKETHENLIKETRKFNPDVVGLVMNTTNRFKVLNLAKEIKEKLGIKVMLGGPHPTLMTQQLLENYNYIDYIIRNEGEFSTLNLMNALEKNKDFKNIKGLSYKKGGEIINNPREAPIMNLDKLPFPDYQFFNLKNYAKQPEHLKEFKDYHQGSVISSRGCPFRCTFCSASYFWGHKIRFRSVQSMIDEIKYQHNNFGIKFIMFNDDNFTSDRQRAIKFCEAFKKEGLHKEIMWQCRAEVNMMNHELISKMKEAGCDMIEFGIEDASEEGLKAFQKSHTLQQVRDAFKLTNKLDVRTRAYFIIGGPHESKENIKVKKKFMLEIKPTIATTCILVAYPKTGIYELGKSQGLFDDTIWLKDLKGEAYHSNAPIYPGPNLSYNDVIEAATEISYWWGSKISKDRYNMFDNIKAAGNMMKRREFRKMWVMGKGVLKSKFSK